MKIDIKNDLSKKYSKGVIVIHWISTLLIFGLFGLGLFMSDLEIAKKIDLVKIHATLGTAVFLLTIIRSVLFFKSPRPADLKTGSQWSDKLAVFIHNSFYVLLLLIGISGIATMILGGYGDALNSGDLTLVMSSDEIPPLKAHALLSFVMMGLVVMHVIGVIKHYVLTKENTLKRIV